MYRFGVIFVLAVVLLVSAFSNALAREERYNAYGEENKKWLFRGKVGYSLPQYEEDITVDGAKFTPSSGGEVDLFADVIHFEGELYYQFTKNFAFGASLGYQAQEEKDIGISTLSGEGAFQMLPVGFGVQYTPAPYGKLRPYIGLGYYYALMSSDFDDLEIDDASGLMVELGADYWIMSSWGINFDLKRYFLETEANSPDAFAETIKSEFTVDPVIFTVGGIYRF